MAAPAAVHAVVLGHVQGVFFRAFVLEKATCLGLTGYVRNMPDGTVEVWAEGDRDKLEELIGFLRIGPPRAVVSSVTTDWSARSGKFRDFRIIYS